MERSFITILKTQKILFFIFLFFLQNISWSTTASCLEKYKTSTPVERFFYESQKEMLSEVAKIDSFEFQTDAKQAFITKMEALLGYRLNESIIDAQNPYVELDFSKTPKLDAIYLSTLLFQSGFSGAFTARVLLFHAQRGTPVYIMATGYMHGKKEKELLKKLQNASPNIHVQEYSFFNLKMTLFEKVSNLLPWKLMERHFRNYHVKSLVTISSEKNENNVVIMGGRNIHDGFLFQKTPDLSSYPNLVQADPSKPNAYWQDLEVKVISKDFALKVREQLKFLWNLREIPNDKYLEAIKDASYSSTEKIETPNDKPSNNQNKNDSQVYARNFISAPFRDGHALENLYIELIDKATKSIQISSPYLRPSPKMINAIKNAADRGVDIKIQTRIKLTGDTAAWLYEETNKAAINDLYKVAKIYEWNEDSILHTKAMIIDDTLAVFGSVNMSGRSFVEDIEGVKLVVGDQFITDLSTILKDYREHSKLITEKQKRKVWASLIVNLLKNQF